MGSLEGIMFVLSHIHLQSLFDKTNDALMLSGFMSGSPICFHGVLTAIEVIFLAGMRTCPYKTIDPQSGYFDRGGV